jgi:6-phosphogluconolactonase
MWNRRQLLKTFPALVIAAPVYQRDPSRVVSLWIGSCANHGDTNGIYGAQFDPRTGTLSAPVLQVRTPRPSYFAILPAKERGRVLYAVNELSNGKGAVAAFTVSADNLLSPLNQVPSQGDGPCYLSVNALTRTVYTANYHGSSISVFPALRDGSVGEAIQHLDFRDPRRFDRPGPDPRQVTPHPHSVTMSPDRRFAIVNDLGNDSIDVFSIHQSDGCLSGDGPVRCKRPPASGPRHIAFHPNRRWAYGISELNSTLQHYRWVEQTTSAQLEPLGPEVSMLGTNAPGQAANAAAEVAISADGRFLYATNRGDDSLTVFLIDQQSGALLFRQRTSSGGKTPRHFLLDRSGAWLLCCNNGSDAVTVFARDPHDGRLDGPRSTAAIECPMFSLFA